MPRFLYIRIPLGILMMVCGGAHLGRHDAQWLGLGLLLMGAFYLGVFLYPAAKALEKLGGGG